MKKQETPETFLGLDQEALKETASNLAEEAAKVVRKHPLEAVGISLAVGVLIGLFINRK